MKVPINWLGEYVKLPKNTKDLTHKLTMVGHMLDKTEKVQGQTVVDLELRGNRADCYSIMGIAREVSALYSTPFKIPQISKVKTGTLKKIKLDIKTPLVKRVMMTSIKNVKITKSPKWLSDKLIAYGIAPINNIVDLTNFVTIETGQPMHAFDLDKTGDNLSIRLAKTGETLTTFQDDVLNLTKEDLVWTNGDNVLSVAGAIGGKYHSISPNTKNVLLEAASYDRANIRRSIHRHNLFTDAGIRHEKELDPNLVDFGIKRFLFILDKYGWGEYENIIFDYYPDPSTPRKLKFDYGFLNILAGFEIKTNEVANIFKRLGFDISSQTNDGFTVLIPTFRTDIENQADLVEEVLRMKGYENIPEKVLALEVPENITYKYLKQEEKVKNVLNSLGFDEVLSLSFVKEKMFPLNTSLIFKNAKPIRVFNRPSPDNWELRATHLPNLLDFTNKIKNERGEEARIFEVGKVFYKNGDTYNEKRTLGLMYWEKDSSSFYNFKKLLESTWAKLNIPNADYKPTESHLKSMVNSYNLSIGKTIGAGGEINGVFFAEIDLDEILDKSHSERVALWPKFPPQIEDITFKLTANTFIGDVINEISSTKHVTEAKLVDTYEDYYTFRIWYQHPDKTLDSQEVEYLRKTIINSIAKKFDGEVR